MPSLRLLVQQALGGGTNGSSAVGIHPDRQRGGHHRPFIDDRRWNLVHGVAPQWRDVSRSTPNYGSSREESSRAECRATWNTALLRALTTVRGPSLPCPL